MNAVNHLNAIDTTDRHPSTQQIARSTTGTSPTAPPGKHRRPAP
jgi:hypothetical protein